MYAFLNDQNSLNSIGETTDVSLNCVQYEQFLSIYLLKNDEIRNTIGEPLE